MQPDELRQFLGKAGDQLEDISLSDYYSQIDRVNVLSNPTHSQAEQNSSLGENIDVPMAIVEKDGDNISANFPERSNSSPLRKCSKPAKILYF
jgi:hypothetical protein